MKSILTLTPVLFFFLACSNKNQDSNAGNKAIMQQYYEKVVNAHNADMVDSFFAADFSDPQFQPEGGQTARDLVKESFKKDFFTSFPDGRANVNFMIASGDTVVTQLTLSGTNTGPINGRPATNKKVSVDGVAVFVLRDGKIIHRHRFFNDLEMMQQLGLMPDMDAKDSMRTESVKSGSGR